MRNRILFVLIALLGLALGYLWTSQEARHAVARSATMPNNPHVVYLSPVDAVHGRLTPQVVEERGGVVLQTWAQVRDMAQKQPLDALLVEQTKFAGVKEEERTWLRQQIENGVIIVGVGIDIEPFSAALGLPNLRAPGEAQAPIGDDGYYLLQALLLGTPEDVAAMRRAEWLAEAIRGNVVKIDTKKPLLAERGGERGKLVTDEDIDRFFVNLYKWIEGVYKSRSDFQQQSTSR